MRESPPPPTSQALIKLTHASGSRAQISLFGAHVTSWVDATGREQLYLSRLARLAGAGGKSIRGGIPVVFPQFADTGPLPMHGFLRTREWSVAHSNATSATLERRDDDATRRLWPHAFLAQLAVTVGDTLSVTLAITNTGTTPFSFTAALHTYFAVDDIRAVRVLGLAGLTYADKTRNFARRVDRDEQVAITEFTDRVYQNAPATLRIAHVAPVAPSQSLVLETSGFGDWVVWNPWLDAIRNFDDMEPDDYLRMLCVEAACIAHPVTLAPGQSWTGAQVARPIAT